MIKLKKMKKKSFKKFVKRSIKKYAHELVKSGYLKKKGSVEEIKREYKGRLSKGLKTPNNKFYNIVNEENNKVGILWILQGEDYFFVKELYIRKKFRHQGYGTETLYKLEEKAKKKNIQRINLGVFNHNKIAKTLYKKAGFENFFQSMFFKVK
jgi:ribosomal protein S18 acetylase RimI-like enzyme